MKIRYRSLFAVICMTAITANVPAGVAVQDRQEKKTEIQTTQRTVTVQGDGKTFTTVPDGVQEGTFNVRVAEPGAAGMGFAVVSGNGQQSGDGMFQFFSQEMSFDNRLVKDAPFSAETLSETVQTLADGNRIVQRSTGHAYRDGQGRTRTERSFRMGGSGGEQKTITIYDPTTGDNFILDPEKRTARKAKMFFRVAGQQIAERTHAQTSMTTEMPKRVVISGGELQGKTIKRVQPVYPTVAKAAGVEGTTQVQVMISETGEVVDASVISGHPLLRDTSVDAARQWQFKSTEVEGKPVKVQGILTFNYKLAGKSENAQNADNPNALTMMKLNSNLEKLGKQMIEGVECEGTRITTTLPAGAIGNENPIQTIHENWVSTDLKMTILTKHTDPRFGETTYRVININRAEPDPGLFTVPSDYKIQEGGPGGTGNFIFKGEKVPGGDDIQIIRRDRPNQR